jgi:hypothetical protein
MNTKLISIAIIIVAAAAYFTKIPGSILLGAIGLLLLILSFISPKYVSDLITKYFIVFKQYKKVASVVAYDALFWAAITGLAYLYQKLFEKKLLAEYAKTGFSKAAILADPTIAAATAESLRGIVLYTIGGLAIFAILTYIAYTISRYFIWTEISSQKRNKQTFWAYARLTGAWWAILLVPAAVIAVAAAKTPSVTALLAIFIIFMAHFTNFLFTNLTKTNKAGQSLTMGIAMGLSKIHRVIVPYAILFAIWWALSTIASIVNYMNEGVATAVTLLFALTILAISRTYLYTIIKSL